MKERSMRVAYLSGERLAMRPMRSEDKAHAPAWFDSVFPIDASRAEEFLKDELKEYTYRKVFLVAVRGDDDAEEIVGGVKVRMNGKHADMHIHMAPWLPDADELRAEMLRLLVAWLHDEAEHITTTAELAADWPATIAAAEASGMQQTARFREWYARPGTRVDRLVYQALRPFWNATTEASNA
jgi:RimJ/RimL family protein N-acetyltransferase